MSPQGPSVTNHSGICKVCGCRDAIVFSCLGGASGSRCPMEHFDWHLEVDRVREKISVAFRRISEKERQANSSSSIVRQWRTVEIRELRDKIDSLEQEEREAVNVAHQRFRDFLPEREKGKRLLQETEFEIETWRIIAGTTKLQLPAAFTNEPSTVIRKFLEDINGPPIANQIKEELKRLETKLQQLNSDFGLWIED
ncbi:MAG: hypothetical protein UW63_C0043G0014 [Candidatus Uhrbacteria bacterium GW2011_GWF2_44_350]|uniref:Uncharacterized protein n=1 Tax=Candidatus Uhrbacteria bacterium GW2011_GWF2_44_350 TaxID=1619000 RepID=A0A0G1MD49_9BACT|nr:MAG: hypothetical protein UW63_C0043G0014 [Candidatus Uhrbacteria bacterium GW2011_GWF2_44_350]HBR80098.1 hypothetical protein [Candidatus Uhrbacteria bacterium]HCU32202.1 hypothetical protein [Candidatus Uhrbacteria bacterium]